MEQNQSMTFDFLFDLLLSNVSKNLGEEYLISRKLLSELINEKTDICLLLEEQSELDKFCCLIKQNKQRLEQAKRERQEEEEQEKRKRRKTKRTGREKNSKANTTRTKRTRNKTDKRTTK